MQVAALIGADPKEIIFTSGATESNNLALKGVANFYSGKKKHIITTQTDHKCVLDSARYLSQRGFEVTYLPVKPDGLLDLELLEQAIRPDTAIVSVMMVNNEIGTQLRAQSIRIAFDIHLSRATVSLGKPALCGLLSAMQRISYHRHFMPQPIEVPLESFTVHYTATSAIQGLLRLHDSAMSFVSVKKTEAAPKGPSNSRLVMTTLTIYLIRQCRSSQIPHISRTFASCWNQAGSNSLTRHGVMQQVLCSP